MNENTDTNQFQPGEAEATDASSNIFLNMAETDSVTGIPSLKQAPVSAISSSASSSKVNTQLVIAACVLAIGAGAVYTMRYVGMQAGLDENIVSIDYASDANAVDFSKRFSSVMDTLDESSLSVQLVDRSSFADQPFARPSAIVDDPEPIDPGMSEEERLAIQQERERQREIELRREMVVSEAMRFTLQGIVGGTNPAARVSGNPVRAGMTLGEYFTVTEINSRSVVIEADGMKFELALGQETIQLD